MARECVAIALSPHPHFDMGKTYAVHFGASGNLSTVIRRRLPTATEAVDAAFPGRVCSDGRFIPYWIILQGGVLSVGVGKVPGECCVGALDDRLYNQLRSGVDAVKFVGLGNSALGRGARDLRVRNVRVLPIPSCFGVEGIPIDEVASVNVDNILPGAGSSDADLLAEYERECEKAKARAEKFGTEYKQPAPDAFLKWSEARKLRANPERGFITGIDVMSPEEQAKAANRKARFADDNNKRKKEGDGDDIANEEEGQGEPWQQEREPLPVEQAWDNGDLVTSQRIDPPEHLYPAHGDVQNMEKDEMGENERASLVPEKIHLFSIDWAAFKQIRSDDVMAHFSEYGPSYVEWLGELSCNVHFEDKYSASRALAALSRELPSPVPEAVKTQQHQARKDMKEKGGKGFKDEKMEETDGKKEDVSTSKAEETNLVKKEGEEESSQMPLPDLGQMGWRFGLHPVRKVSNDKFGRRGTKARFLLRVATSDDMLVERPTERPRPPPGFTTKRVLGPGSDYDTSWRRGRGRGGKKKMAKRQKKGGNGRTKRQSRSDGENWQRDRYQDDSGDEPWQRDKYEGDEDDEEWEDDEGYSDDEDMGEELDQGCGDDDKEDTHGDKLPAGLDRGLKAARPGFSVEEMEKEREAKKAAAM